MNEKVNVNRPLTIRNIPCVIQGDPRVAFLPTHYSTRKCKNAE